MKKNSLIYVAGHRGMVGSAIVRSLTRQGFTNLVVRSHKELDLTNQNEVNKFFADSRPEYVFLAAAHVGGIIANSSNPAMFMYQNSLIEFNVITAAANFGATKLEFLGSSCIYPRDCPQPIKEEYLLTGPLEKTNEAYALAKIAGLKYCKYLNESNRLNCISVMPTNLYGINDNYDPINSHVVPGLLRRFHEAKVNKLESVKCWGDGSPLREFMFSEDLGDLCVYLMQHYDASDPINAGTGEEISIYDLAVQIAQTVGYNGKIEWDHSKPNGTPRKLLDLTKLKEMGWTDFVPLSRGLQLAYEDFLRKNV